jgi:hypothetical protein
MSLTRIAGVVAAALYTVTVLFQLAIAAGAPWGRAAYGGYVESPGVELRITSVIAAVVWSAAALIILRRSGHPVWAPLPDRALPVAVWVLVGLGVLGVASNAISQSPLERAIWVPVTVIMLASALTVALGARRAGRVERA